MVISEFKGEYKFLDNFYFAAVLYKGITFLNSEAAFQAQKCKNNTHKLEFMHLDPYEAKKRGNTIELRVDWEKIKDRIMYEIVKAKFIQNRDLKEKLLCTGSAILEEGNHHSDTYWGTVNGKGENKLGKILMQVREELKKMR